MSIGTVDIFLNMYGDELLVGRLAYKDSVVYFEYDANSNSKCNT